MRERGGFGKGLAPLDGAALRSFAMVGTRAETPPPRGEGQGWGAKSQNEFTGK